MENAKLRTGTVEKTKNALDYIYNQCKNGFKPEKEVMIVKTVSNFYKRDNKFNKNLLIEMSIVELKSIKNINCLHWISGEPTEEMAINVCNEINKTKNVKPKVIVKETVPVISDALLDAITVFDEKITNFRGRAIEQNNPDGLNQLSSLIESITSLIKINE